MTDFLKKCEEYYSTNDFYEILNLNRDATQKDIKKAYHKLSLLIHPDRVEESKKAEATEKFKVLGKIHSILQDPDKRAVYDESGNFDEETDSSLNWMDYWRSLFKRISTKDIEDYEKEYIGSEAEMRDLKRAYVNSKGDMNTILQFVAFSNCDSESRFIEIIRKLVDDGEVEEYDRFFNEPEKKKQKRRRDLENERKLCEESKIADQDLEREIQLNHERREREFGDLISKLEAKYKKSSSKRKSIPETASTGSNRKRSKRSKK